MIMDNEKVEIKIQSRFEYYIDIIKKKLIKQIFGILILLGVPISLIYSVVL